VVVFTDPWLSPAVEHGRHVLISHADSASPFDSLIGAFALTELIAAKVVVALGEEGLVRVGDLESLHEQIGGPLSDVAEASGRNGDGE
jgi:DNA-binding MurR/RpiR family transcriptional regulator